MKIKLKILFFTISFIFFQCKQTKSPDIAEYQPSTLEKIQSEGVLKVVTDFNSTSYFIYRGQPLGYQFELLQELADFLDVKLEISANSSLDEKFKMLNEGEVDLIAVNLTVTSDRKDYLLFTEPYSKTRQVLVQRLPENWNKMSKKAREESVLTDQLELAGKEVYVQQNSTYSRRLHNLSEEIGDSINIVETDESVESLINKVSSGDIDFTVCDENLAQVNSTFYDNIDISLPVSFSQNLAWAVDKNSSELQQVINSWMIDFKKTKKYAVIYKKYFNNKRSSEIIESKLYANKSGTISLYDDIIKEYSEDIGWDWRLVASMIYQESRFNPNAKSWSGAFGLMQLMPVTAKRFGVTESSSARQQIRAGVLFIHWLDNLFAEIDDPVEREKFVLGAYNIGPGHVIDAMNLAEKNGKDPCIWNDNVAFYLLKKSYPEYYRDPVVKYGYCRGTETYKYVSDIFSRFEHYKNIVN